MAADLAPSSASDERRTYRVTRIALACALAGLLLRAAYLFAVQPAQETPGLTRKYEACATNLLAGDGYFLQVGKAPVPYVDRVPGYVTLVAGLMALLGTSPMALGLAHATLGSAQAAAAAAAGGVLGGARAAWLAGLLVAGWPPLWKSDVQRVETGVAGLVLLLLVAAALQAARQASAGALAALTTLSLVAVLLRPDYLLLPLAVAAWQSATGGSRAWAWVAATLLAPALACGLWAARNGRVADAAFVSVGLGTNLLAAVGESVITERPTFGDKDVAVAEGHQGLYWPDPHRRDQERVRRALDLIRAEPAGYLRGCVRRVAVTLSMHPGQIWPGPAAEEEILRFRRENPGLPRYEGIFRAVAAHALRHPISATATFGWAPVALAGAVLGAWRLRRRRGDLVVLLALPAYAVAVHVPLHAEPRYFLPFLPILLVLGAAGLLAAGPAAPPGPVEA